MLGWLVVNRAPEARSRLGVWAVAMLAALVLSAVTAEPAGASIWAIQRAPAVAGAKDSVLQSVSCTAAVACIAVGGPDQRPGVMLAEGWDGSRWTVQPTPRPRGSIQSFLSGVSCVSESSCMAVGFAVDSNGAVRVVTTRWTGLSWALVPGAKGRRSIPSFLASVSCTSLTECTAVGASENRSGTFFPLVERWNGSRWLVQATPRLPDSQLAGVSCASARACTAVGDYAGVAELVEHWNGTRWSRDLRANLVSGESGLGAVSCTSPTSCAAGGARGPVPDGPPNRHEDSHPASYTGCRAHRGLPAPPSVRTRSWRS